MSIGMSLKVACSSSSSSTLNSGTLENWESPPSRATAPPIMFSGFFLPRVGIFLAPVRFQMRPNLFLIISLAALNIKEESEDESASPKESCVEIFPCGSGVSINIKTWVFYQGWFPRFGFFISRPYAVFYTMKVVFYKRVHILFISIIFEAKTVILPFFISLTSGC